MSEKEPVQVNSQGFLCRVGNTERLFFRQQSSCSGIHGRTRKRWRGDFTRRFVFLLGQGAGGNFTALQITLMTINYRFITNCVFSYCSVQQEDRGKPKEDKKAAGVGQRGDQHAGSDGGIALQFGH